MAIACVAAVIVTALAAHGTGRCSCNRCPLGNGAGWGCRVESARKQWDRTGPRSHRHLHEEQTGARDCLEQKRAGGRWCRVGLGDAGGGEEGVVTEPEVPGGAGGE